MTDDSAPDPPGSDPFVAHALAIALLASACGARTGLDVTVPPADAGIPRDAGWDAAVRPDAGADASVRPDAGDIRLACNGDPLPGPSSVRSLAVPPQMDAVIVQLPDPRGILVLGGFRALDEPATASFLDLASGASQPVRMVGPDPVLPTSGATATYVPDGDHVIVVGGRVDGVASDRVLRLRREGDPGGDWRMRVEVLAPFPAGTVINHVAIYDPIGRRVIVHGGSSSDPIPIRRRQTWALGERGDWTLVADRPGSPYFEVRAMGYDPVRHRAIEIVTIDEGRGVSVHALDLALGSEGWERQTELDFAPSTRGELIYDPRVCGFHLLSARRTRCVLEHWVLSFDDLDRPTTYRGELELGDDAHFLAAASFDPVTRQIVLLGSAQCANPTRASEVAHAVLLE